MEQRQNPTNGGYPEYTLSPDKVSLDTDKTAFQMSGKRISGSILEIKRQRIGDPAKQDNLAHELAVLTAVRDKGIPPTDEVDCLTGELRELNDLLWTTEEQLRACERANKFGADFVRLERSVYANNDRRARLKRAINEALGSTLIEEKSYCE